MKRFINREDIIKAGYDLMFLKGYGGTAIKDITEKIDIPKGSFYNHFKSKEEFGIEVLRYYMGQQEMVTGILSNRELTPVNRLKSFFNEMIIQQKKSLKYKLGCLCGNFSQELGDTNDVFSKEIKKSFAKMRQAFEKCIQEAKDAGQIKSKRANKIIADFLINSWEGALLRMKSEKSTAPLEQFVEIFFEDVLKAG